MAEKKCKKGDIVEYQGKKHKITYLGRSAVTKEPVAWIEGKTKSVSLEELSEIKYD
jgi:DNA-binding Xre family transcriptional regulator